MGRLAGAAEGRTAVGADGGTWGTWIRDVGEVGGGWAGPWAAASPGGFRPPGGVGQWWLAWAVGCGFAGWLPACGVGEWVLCAVTAVGVPPAGPAGCEALAEGFALPAAALWEADGPVAAPWEADGPAAGAEPVAGGGLPIGEPSAVGRPVPLGPGLAMVLDGWGGTCRAGAWDCMPIRLLLSAAATIALASPTTQPKPRSLRPRAPDWSTKTGEWSVGGGIGPESGCSDRRRVGATEGGPFRRGGAAASNARGDGNARSLDKSASMFDLGGSVHPL
ncbi:hypothetical protein GCM10010430_20420 [Kitasatospora cystarginea]|uniref:Uncharacterized protein n=1 Tax=Kitasatospora cystarginea TaxID=58350 RepID=A0ABN3DQP8_9ACTN